jgi:hypothetical protein
MTTSFVGAASAEATSVTLPTHQKGDLIAVWALRAANSLPTIPATWFAAGSRTSTGIGGLLAWKIAASSSETSGTWTNAAALLAVVYRHTTNLILPGGVSLANTATSTTINYSLMLGNSSTGIAGVMRAASSVVACGVWALTNTATIETVPTFTSITPVGSTFTLRNNAVLTTYEAAWFDTNATVTGMNTGSATASGSVTTITFTMEINDTGVAKSSGGFRPVNIRGGADQ